MEATRLWTKIVAAAAGALSATGAPGPQTRLGPRRAHEAGDGPWLGIFHLEGLGAAERELFAGWLREQAMPLLAVRNLILAEPVSRSGDVAIELMTPPDLRPPEWEARQHPVLVFVAAHAQDEGRHQRRAAYLELRRRASYLPEAPELWAERAFDAEVGVQLARLALEEEREAFKRRLDKSLHRSFDRQLPLLETLFLDDLAGVRDHWDPRSTACLLASSKPGLPALAAFAAEEDSATFLSGSPRKRRYSFAQQSAGGFERADAPVPDQFRAGLHEQGFALLESEVEDLWKAVKYLDENGFPDLHP